MNYKKNIPSSHGSSFCRSVIRLREWHFPPSLFYSWYISLCYALSLFLKKHLYLFNSLIFTFPLYYSVSVKSRPKKNQKFHTQIYIYLKNIFLSAQTLFTRYWIISISSFIYFIFFYLSLCDVNAVNLNISRSFTTFIFFFSS